MRSNRLIGFPVLLVAMTGCLASHAPNVEPTPSHGPTAHIYATYTGGLTQRTLRASFSVDRDADVLVGHLGGDGVIRILWPQDARTSDIAKRGKTYSVGPVYANYDGVPQLYSFTTRAWRSPGARTDSYDGRGNGFVFMIVSTRGFDRSALQDHGLWTNDYEVEGYEWISDPRTAVREFADAIAMRGMYTLKYANSFGTNAFTTYADRQIDCAMFGAQFGFGSLLGDQGLSWWGGGFTLSSWYFMPPSMIYPMSNDYLPFYGSTPGCGYSMRTYAYGFMPRYYHPREYTPTLAPPPSPTVTPAPTTPTTPAPAPLNRRFLGPRFGDEAGRYSARTNTPRDLPRTNPSSSAPSWSPSAPSNRPTRVAGGGLRNPERFDPPPFARSPSEDRHYAPRHDARGDDGPRTFSPSPRETVSHTPSPATYSPPAPAPAPPPAHSAGTPSPRVEASSGGKPRDP